jgi:hypothetical protein
MVHVWLVLPVYKWAVLGRITPAKAARSDLSWRFRSHLWLGLLHSHVTVAYYAFVCSALMNAWLRLLGMTVGRQAWVSEGLDAREPDLLEIGDHVSICSGVTANTSAGPRAGKIVMKPACDVTNDVRTRGRDGLWRAGRRRAAATPALQRDLSYAPLPSAPGGLQIRASLSAPISLQPLPRQSVLFPGTVVGSHAILGVNSIGLPGQFAEHSICQARGVARPRRRRGRANNQGGPHLHGMPPSRYKPGTRCAPLYTLYALRCELPAGPPPNPATRRRARSCCTPATSPARPAPPRPSTAAMSRPWRGGATTSCSWPRRS